MTNDEVADETASPDKVHIPLQSTEELEMMYDMGWGMGSTGWLVLTITVLGVAALIKYLMSGRK